MNASVNCHVLDYASRKSRRVVQSIMGGDMCAFIDAFDVAFAVAADLRSITSHLLDSAFSTDSRQLFDALVKGK